MVLVDGGYQLLLNAGYGSWVAFNNQDYNHIGSLLSESTQERVSHQHALDRIEGGMEGATGPLLDDKMYELVCELGARGTVKDMRVKLFGIEGRGGYWNMVKVQKRIAIEPDVYGLIAGVMWSGFVNKSAEGGQFNLNLFNSLLHVATQVSKQNLSPIVRMGIQDLVVQAVKIGLLGHNSITACLHVGAISAESVYDFEKLSETERGLYFAHLLKTLDTPKTPQG